MQFTKANGLTTRQKERAHFGMLRAIYIPANSKPIKRMDLAFTLMLMAQGMKETGSMMFKKVKVKKPGLMVLNMWENTVTE